MHICIMISGLIPAVMLRGDIHIHCVQPKGLLPCSQDATTGPCPTPDESSQHYHTIFIKNQF